MATGGFQGFNFGRELGLVSNPATGDTPVQAQGRLIAIRKWRWAVYADDTTPSRKEWYWDVIDIGTGDGAVPGTGGVPGGDGSGGGGGTGSGTHFSGPFDFGEQRPDAGVDITYRPVGNPPGWGRRIILEPVWMTKRGASGVDDKEVVPEDAKIAIRDMLNQLIDPSSIWKRLSEFIGFDPTNNLLNKIIEAIQSGKVEIGVTSGPSFPDIQHDGTSFAYPIKLRINIAELDGDPQRVLLYLLIGLIIAAGGSGIDALAIALYLSELMGITSDPAGTEQLRDLMINLSDDKINDVKVGKWVYWNTKTGKVYRINGGEELELPFPEFWRK